MTQSVKRQPWQLSVTTWGISGCDESKRESVDGRRPIQEDWGVATGRKCSMAGFAAKNGPASDPNLPNYLSRLHYNTMYLPKILERIEKTAPPGADLTSWRY